MSVQRIQALKRISVINAETGIELYNKDFEPNFYLEHDNQLISGFISALIGFSKSIVRDEIQEIVFANSKLFIQRFQKVIIVMMTTLNSNRFSIQRLISNLGNQIESNVVIRKQIDVISAESYSKLEEIVNREINTEDEFQVEPLTKKHPKIVVAGLKQVGKTTTIHKFFYSWDKERLRDIKPTVDYSILHSFLDFLSAELTIFDLGGQSQYIDNHLKMGDRWKEAAAIIFMVDISIPDDFSSAYRYLASIIDKLKENNEEPFIGLFVHKYDPNKTADLQPYIQDFLNEFRGIFTWPRYSIFLTSIYDESLHLAFMRTLVRIIPRDLFKTILESSIFFEICNQVWTTISQQSNIDLERSESRDKIIGLAVPYGEKLANEILSEWIAGGTKASLIKLQNKSLIAEVADIQGGLRIKIEFPDQNDRLLSLTVTEGILTGLGNFFSLSNIIRFDEGIKPGKFFAIWGLYEF